MEIINEIVGSQILKANHILTDRYHFFSRFFQIFFKAEVMIPYSKKYFSISFIRLVQTNFLPTEIVFV